MHRVRRSPPLKAAAKAAGGTINDAILAAVAGMLQRYFEIAGSVVKGTPVALIPVSSPPDRSRRAATGSRRSSWTCRPTSPIPSRASGSLNATMADIKDSAAVRAGALAVAAGGLAPPLLSAGLARAMSGVRAFNLVVSNVPGPQQTFYLNGQRWWRPTRAFR